MTSDVFIDTHEGVTLVVMDGAIRGATALELTMRSIVRDLTDPDECTFDHHGNCQAHGWTQTDPKCPHARAKELKLNGD